MLSILIPIYNFPVAHFLGQLVDQAGKLDVYCEVICLDDASEPSMHQNNQQAAAKMGVKYVRSEKNLGRSAARNELVRMANTDHLLILDCDGSCPDNRFLMRYVQHLHSSYDVIYGGRIYSEDPPDDPDLYFHWYVGSNREAIEPEERLINPYKSFMTNNFLIRREVFEKVKMDERLTGYGHEDTLFALELKRAGYRLDHINNPIEHLGIEPFDVYISKSENAVRNLSKLVRLGLVDDGVRLVQYYNRLNRIGMAAFVSKIVERFEGRIMHNLKGPAPNLLWFDLWKLSLLYRFMKE
ncbi:MAG: glycosyltransferase [Salibacteraceae bacterium]